MDSSAGNEEFVVLITGIQARLYAYLLSLLGDPHTAADVLQETNLVLWRKADQYVPGTDFSAWAFSVAYLQVLAARQKLSRERLVFDETLLKELSVRATERSEAFENRMALLYECMKKLSDRYRDLIQLSYAEGKKIRDIAEDRGETVGAVAQALFRARVSLLKCIQNGINKQGN